MQNVFDYIKENESDLYINKIDVAFQTCISDPQNSIVKSFRVLEDIIERLFKLFAISRYTDEMYKCINQLERDIPEVIIRDLHTIRILRNKAAHSGVLTYEFTDGDNVDSAEAFYVIKKLYDVLGWYINLGKLSKIEFDSFDTISQTLLVESKSISLGRSKSVTKSDEDEIKAGVIAQTRLKDILERLVSEEDIERLTSYEYSKNTFNISVPLLSTTRSGKSKARYYSNPVKIGSKRYYVCNGWNDNNKELLLNWMKDWDVK